MSKIEQFFASVAPASSMNYMEGTWYATSQTYDCGKGLIEEAFGSDSGTSGRVRTFLERHILQVDDDDQNKTGANEPKTGISGKIIVFDGANRGAEIDIYFSIDPKTEQ